VAGKRVNAFPAVGSEVPSFRTAFSKTFVGQGGGYIARVYPQAVNYKAPDGSMQTIDDRLVPATGGFTNRADGQRVLLPARVSDAARVSTPKGDVSFRLLGAAGAAPAVSGARDSYREVLPGVSLTYAVLPGALKEAIVLSSANAPRVFRFALSLSAGLSPKLDRAGNLRVSDAKGHVIYTIPAATMTDATPPGKLSPIPAVGRVGVALSRAATGWILAFTPDRSYLISPARKFPVVIDPTVDSNAGVDCEIAGGTSSSFSGCPNNLSAVGTGNVDSGYPPIRTAIQLPLSNAIPADANVLSAKLSVDVQSTVGDGAPLSVSAYGLTHAFTSSATWTNFDGVNPWATPGGDHDSSPLSSATITGPGWASFPMTALVQSWVDGSRANNGVVLASPPSAFRAALLYSTGPVTYPGAAAGDPYPPYLDIYYIPRLGTPRAATINQTRLTDRMSLGVNVANGNLLVHNTDLSVPGAGLNSSVERTYNNLGANAIDFGHGWTSSAGREPILAGYPDSIWLYTPDGAITRFQNDAAGGYITPPGTDATLCSSYTQAGCPGLPAGATFLLAYRDGTRQSYTVAGELIATTDQNNNKLSYQLTQQYGALVKATDTQGRTFSFTNSGPNIGYQTQSITDDSYPGGRHTSYGYTAGNLTSYVDAATKTTLYGYDAQNNLTQITDPSGNITRFTFDSANRVKTVLRVTDAALGTGDTTSYSYNASSTAMPGYAGGCPAAGDGTVPYQQTVVTDAKGNRTYYCYDTHDRVYFVLDALGHQRQSTYNIDDNVVKFNDPTGTVVTSAYDTKDRACAGIEPASAAGQAPVAQHLDFGSVPATKTVDPCLTNTPPQTGGTHPYYADFGRDPQGNQTDLGYDANNNLSSSIDHATGIGVHLNHNPNGTLSSSLDGNSNQTTYGYFTAGDPNGHPSDLKSVTPPGPLGASSYTYDAISRVATYTDGKGQTTTFAYDALDRVTETDYADGSSIKYTHDNSGNTLQTVDSINGTSTYTPDTKNRITSEQLATGKTNQYAYDANNNLQAATDSGGTTTYGYDSVNNNTTVLEPGSTTAITLAYDMNNRNTCVTHPNGVVVQNNYLLGGEVTRTTALKPGASCATTPAGANRLTDQKYSYTAGTGGTSDTQLRQTMTNIAGNVTSYSYDSLNRLREASASGDDRKYTLDSAGNITSRVVNAATTTMAYNAANQICWASNTSSPNACASAPLGATSYTFDANGNELGSGAGLSLAYNARNQTTNITSGGTAHLLAYLGGGQGTLTAVGSDSILNSLLGVSGQTTSGQTTYDSRDINSNLLHQRAPAGTYTYLQDGLGSVVGLTDASGNVVNTAVYDAYGQTTSSTGTTASPFGYAGGLGAAGGLTKFGERYYDPSIGRWTQPDAEVNVASTSGANGYAYVDGNPASFVDPNGRCAIPFLGDPCKTAKRAAGFVSRNALRFYSIGELLTATAVTVSIATVGTTFCVLGTAGAASAACAFVFLAAAPIAVGSGYAIYREIGEVH